MTCASNTLTRGLPAPSPCPPRSPPRTRDRCLILPAWGQAGRGCAQRPGPEGAPAPGRLGKADCSCQPGHPEVGFRDPRHKALERKAWNRSRHKSPRQREGQAGGTWGTAGTRGFLEEKAERCQRLRATPTPPEAASRPHTQGCRAPRPARPCQGVLGSARVGGVKERQGSSCLGGRAGAQAWKGHHSAALTPPASNAPLSFPPAATKLRDLATATQLPPQELVPRAAGA